MLYGILTEILDEYNGNIIYVRSYNNKLVKYMYLNDASYFANYSIGTGRQISLEGFRNKSKDFLSSNSTKDNNQIGRLNEFAGDNNLEIRTLWDMCDDNTLTLSGYATVQLPKDNIQEFIEELEIYTRDKIQVSEKIDINFNYDNSSSNYIVYALYFLLLLLVIYDSLKNYKNVGIKKLLGYSNRDIWICNTKKIFFMQVFSILVVILLMSLYFFSNINVYLADFLFKLIMEYVKQTIIMLLLSSIAYGYILSIKVSDMLKNKKTTMEIIVFNTIIKCILMGIVIVMAMNITTNFVIVKNAYNTSYEKWDKASNYECISGSNIDGNTYFSDEMEEKLKTIYLELNRRGSMFEDFSNLSDSFKQMNSAPVGKEYIIDYATINLNYLLENEVKDENGNNVIVSEDEEKNILLIPELYKDKEKEVVEYYVDSLSSYMNGKKYYIEDMKVIWIMDNQELFSYNIEVNSNENNMVKNAVYMVMTEGNLMDRAFRNIIDYLGNPLKIIKDDSYDLNKYISEIIGGNYEYTIISADEQIASEVTSAKETIKYNTLVMLGVLIGILIIIIQNLYNYVEQYKRDLFIKSIHGYSFFMKYKLSILINIISGILSSILAMLILKDNYLCIMGISFIGIIIELILWIIILRIMEKRKIINVVKGC